MLGTNTKLEKTNGTTGVLVTGLSLSPADTSGVNLCAYSTGDCRNGCVAHTGHGQRHSTIAARLRKSLLLHEDPDAFGRLLWDALDQHARRAERYNLEAAVRLNMFSDLPWERMPFTIDGERLTVLDAWADRIRFYDYTKYPPRLRPTSSRYHLTYSVTGYNLARCLRAVDAGANAAVVFDTPKGAPLPDTFHGFDVVDGDASDLRYLDPPGTIVGLRLKATSNAMRAAMLKTRFVYRVEA